MLRLFLMRLRQPLPGERIGRARALHLEFGLDGFADFAFGVWTICLARNHGLAFADLAANARVVGLRVAVTDRPLAFAAFSLTKPVAFIAFAALPLSVVATKLVAGLAVLSPGARALVTIHGVLGVHDFVERLVERLQFVQLTLHLI